MLAPVIVALYALLPAMLLSSHSLLSGAFYALIAASLVLLIQQRFGGVIAQTRKYCGLIASYSVLFLAVAASSFYHGDWAGANSEGALRFFLGLWILLLALPHIEIHRLRHAIWGVYVGSIVSTATLLWLIINVEPRPLTPGVILTTYSSIMLLLGAISVYSIKWQLTASPRLEGLVKVLVAVITFIGFLAAQTRTGLLGLPLFILLAIVLFVGIKKPCRVLAWLVASVILIAAAIGSDNALRSRIVEGVQEVRACQGENSTQPSSMCIRLQLWRTAVDAGISHPWVGLGKGGKFIEYMESVAVPKGLAAPYVVTEQFGEPHNDLLLILAGFGFPGVLGLLLIYLVPSVYFLPRLLKHEASHCSRAAAAMGLAVCLGFFLFGFTETMFRRMNTIGFYVAMVALFIVLSDPRSSRQEMSSPPTL